MAKKPSPNSLIHCSQCGEDYSATYKKCPFCGAKNVSAQSDPDRPAAGADLEDTYVFDGQDLFDDKAEEEDAPTQSRGGKRLAGTPLANPFANADINWPRVITFICSLIIIVAAMVIVFTVVYPQLRGDPTVDSSQSPSSTASAPGSDITQSVDPTADVSDPNTSDPVTEPTDSVPPTASGGLRGFTANNAAKDSTFSDEKKGFTLQEGGSWQLRLTFDPADWSGEVTYSVSDTRYATVSASGNVTNVNPDSSLHGVILTITAGGITMEMPVYCRGVSAAQPTASQPPASNPPASKPPASDPPATQTPSGSGGVTVGKQGTIVGATGGLNVRSGPGTSYERIGSLLNGNTINVLEDAGNGWYKISFSGVGGVTTEGYIMGTYISTK